MEEEIDLKSMLVYFKKKRTLLVYIILCFLVLANILFFVFNGLVYSSVGKIYISTDSSNNKLASYKDILSSDSVIDSAIINANINANKEYIKKNLSITANDDSKIYSITLKYKNREEGNILCSSIINEFINRMNLYENIDITFLDNVITSDNPINFNIVKNELLYIAVGTILAFGYVFVLFYFDNKIKGEMELINYNLLGTINKNKSNIELVKTKIKLGNKGNVIFLNTPKDIDCKDEVLLLVNEFAKDARVLFIDANVRIKSVNEGYSNLLKNYKDNISKYIVSNNYDILESGTINKEVEVLLSNKNNEKLLKELKKKYDYVILYNSNTALYSDSLILSKLCDCNYLIVGINQTDKRDFSKSIESYKQINSDVNGIIIIDKE